MEGDDCTHYIPPNSDNLIAARRETSAGLSPAASASAFAVDEDAAAAAASTAGASTAAADTAAEAAASAVKTVSFPCCRCVKVSAACKLSDDLVVC